MRQKSPIPFSGWRPDMSIIEGQGDVRGCIPLAGRYAPLLDLQIIRPGSQINDHALGGKSFYDSTGAPVAFLGDVNQLYRVVGKQPVSVGKAGGYTASADWAWSFEQFGNNIVAVARGAPPQRWQLGVSTAFADLSGAPSGDVVFRIRQHLFICNGRTVNVSAFNNITNWTPSTATQSFITEIPQANGLAVAGWSGEQGALFQERGIIRITYTGGAVPFIFDEVEGGRGLCGPNAWSPWGRIAFCVAEDGFYTFDGASVTSIGGNRVDKYFSDKLNYGYRHKVWSMVDAKKKAWMVGFPANGAVRANEVLIYSWADDKWTHDEMDVPYGFQMHREPVDADYDAGLETLFGTTDADAAAFANVSADSPIFRESRKEWAVVNGDRQLCQFTGAARAATLSTGTFEPIPGRKTFLTEVWPIVDAPASLVTAQVGSRLDRLAETETVSSAATMVDQGFCPIIAEGRYMRAQVNIIAGATWTEANGVLTDGAPSGEF